MDTVDILDVSQLRLAGDFDAQVRDVLQFVRLTREEVENLRLLYEDLEQTLRTRWHDCKIHPFGSIVTGLGIKTSDADCFVEVPFVPSSQKNSQICVKAARNTLQRYPDLFTKLFVILSAKVPIVQFTHVPTQIHCDVSFTSHAGTRNSELICFMMQLDSRVLPMTILIKYWSKVHGLTGTNKLPNYSLIMMTIFYLQQIDVLPSVEYLQNSAAQTNMVDNWNTSFMTNKSQVPPSQNKTPLYGLLRGFFEYYRDFDYKDSIISPYLGRPLKKTWFKGIEHVPNEFSQYINNVTNNNCPPIKTETNGLICVQDPFQHNRNCTAGVFPRLFATLVAYFRQSVNIFEGCPRDSVLGEWLRQPPPNIPVPPKRVINIGTVANGTHNNRPNKIVKRKNNSVLPPHLQKNKHNNKAVWNYAVSNAQGRNGPNYMKRRF
ncbi:hypothetical protein JYU34_013340 [Plutella xylostella]|uniref:Uncharacterized protein n=1 Tax=Plutella xylostella TaxID=51655 RepID=A0ABQ7Q9K6_PLUXY|nr:hypothetical protein JYU34_013340 [Plutella xylostella]